jgi:hypothetical protein
MRISYPFRRFATYFIFGAHTLETLAQNEVGLFKLLAQRIRQRMFSMTHGIASVKHFSLNLALDALLVSARIGLLLTAPYRLLHTLFWESYFLLNSAMAIILQDALSRNDQTPQAMLAQLGAFLALGGLIMPVVPIFYTELASARVLAALIFPPLVPNYWGLAAMGQMLLGIVTLETMVGLGMRLRNQLPATRLGEWLIWPAQVTQQLMASLAKVAEQWVMGAEKLSQALSALPLQLKQQCATCFVSVSGWLTTSLSLEETETVAMSQGNEATAQVEAGALPPQAGLIFRNRAVPLRSQTQLFSSQPEPLLESSVRVGLA